MAKFQSSSLQFNVAIKETLEATQKEIVAVAKREHGRVMRTDPRPMSFTRFVDGVKGAPEENVKALGVIEYLYPRLEMIVQAAMESLYDLSPVLTGLYRESHTIFINGVAVQNMKSWKPGDDLSIANSVIYARKIEQGRQKMKVPPHVYEVTATKLKRRYGNLANIRFTYRGIVGGAMSVGKAKGHQDMRYPAITISER